MNKTLTRLFLFYFFTDIFGENKTFSRAFHQTTLSIRRQYASKVYEGSIQCSIRQIRKELQIANEKLSLVEGHDFDLLSRQSEGVERLGKCTKIIYNFLQCEIHA